MGFKFELKTVDGDDAGSFETAVRNWEDRRSSRHPAYEGAVDDKSADDDCEQIEAHPQRVQTLPPQ